MTDVLKEIADWSDRGERVAVATVVAVHRSAPMPPGTKMAISDSGGVVGAVSGGCVEGAAIEVAEEVLAGGCGGGAGSGGPEGGPPGGEPRLLHFGIADSEAWDVGLPCGGEIDVWV